jgi:hypothetical protein
MNSLLGLLLFVSLRGALGADAPVTHERTENKDGGAKPDWARDIPDASAGESALELQRRIREGQMVRVRAVVEAFLPMAVESFSLNGSADVHIAGTSVKIVFPAKFHGLKLVIHHSATPAGTSCWRLRGCQAEFDVHERLLEARRARMDGFWFTYENDLKNITFLPSAAQKKAKPPITKKPKR